jgi:hypothetical protein
MPSLFDDVIGHEDLCQVLARVVARPGQAYLFHGPAGIGKRTVAERFAASLLFGSEEGAKLDRSRLDQQLQAHPDFIRPVREEGAKEFSVRQARELLQRVSLSSARGGKTVVLFDEADALNEEAGNALLKTIEEPASSLVFILLVERLDRLPATLRSRLAPLAFQPVPARLIAEWLKTKHGVTDPEPFVEAARGCPGRGLAHANDRASWQRSKEQANFFAEGLLHGDLAKRLAVIERLTGDVERKEDSAQAWRDVLESCALAIQSEWTSHPLETVRMARGLIHASRMVGGSLSPRFALEWNGTLPFVPNHSIPRYFDSSSLFSL